MNLSGDNQRKYDTSRRYNDNRNQRPNPYRRRYAGNKKSRSGYNLNSNDNTRNQEIHSNNRRFSGSSSSKNQRYSNQYFSSSETSGTVQSNASTTFVNDSSKVDPTKRNSSFTTPSTSINSRCEDFQKNAQCQENEQEPKQPTVLELIKEVCNEPNANELNIASKFFQILVAHLLSLTDTLPEQRSYIYNIISALVDVGMKCANNESTTEKPEVPGNQSNHFRDLQSLINVDCRLQVLLQERVTSYQNIYELILRKQKDQPSVPSEIQLPYFDKGTIQKGLAKIKSEMSNTSKSFNDLKSEVIIPEECPKDGETDETDKVTSLTVLTPNEVESKSSKCLLLEKPKKVNSIENNDNGRLIKYSELSFGAITSTELLCFSVYEQVIIAGYKNGSLLIFSLNTGALLDNVQPHRKAVTSVTVWENEVITTSLDGSIKIYDLVKHTIKKLIVGQEIFTSYEFNGILYLGTKTGYVIRLLLKDMKQISHPFCVGPETVVVIKVIEEKNKLLMLIAPSGKYVSIRDGTTGSLIQLFRNTKDATCLTVLNVENTLRICAGCKDEMVVTGLNNPSATSVRVKLTITCMIIHEGIIFAASNNEILLFDEKNINLLGKLPKVNGIIKALAFWSNFLIVATSTEGFKYMEIPNNLINIKNKNEKIV